MDKTTKKLNVHKKETPTLVLKKKSPVRMRPTPSTNVPKNLTKTPVKPTVKFEEKPEKITKTTTVSFGRLGSFRYKQLVATPKLNSKKFTVTYETPKTAKTTSSSATKLLTDTPSSPSCKTSEKVTGKPRNFAGIVDKNRLKENLESIRKGMRNVKISNKKKEQHSQTEVDVLLEAEVRIKSLESKIASLEEEIKQYQEDIRSKQIEANFLDEMITMRDGLCQDLQNKLSECEQKLKDTCDNLDLIKSHHNLALEANESIRKEYRAEIEVLKSRHEDEKYHLTNKSSSELSELKEKYEQQIKSLTEDFIQEMEKKENETTAKIEHFQEKSSEQLRLSEIQYEQKIQDIQRECDKLQYDMHLLQDKNCNYKLALQSAHDLNSDLRAEIEHLNSTKDINTGRDSSCENEINKLKADIATVRDENQKYEISLMITHDTVNILSQRLRNADQEVDNLEQTLRLVAAEKQKLLQEIESYKQQIENINTESNEYKDSLVNILKSKSNLVKEHNRIMEHNVSLIECLSNVEQEAYNELGTIKNELLADIEGVKTESKVQIEKLKSELLKSNAACEEARRDAVDAASQCSQLLRQAENALQQLEQENMALSLQIQDQQTFTSEYLVLQQENEKLMTKLAEQSSIIDQLRTSEKYSEARKSPMQFGKKTHKLGKENSTPFVSPLKERNRYD